MPGATVVPFEQYVAAVDGRVQAAVAGVTLETGPLAAVDSAGTGIPGATLIAASWRRGAYAVVVSQVSIDAVVVALTTVEGEARTLVHEDRDDLSTAGAERIAAGAIALFEGFSDGRT